MNLPAILALLSALAPASDSVMASINARGQIRFVANETMIEEILPHGERILWDVAGRRIVSDQKPKDLPENVSFSPNRRFVAVIDDANNVRVLTYPRLTQVAALDCHGAGIDRDRTDPRRFVWSDNNRYLLIYGEDDQFLFDLRSGRRRRLPGLCAFAPGSRTLVQLIEHWIGQEPGYYYSSIAILKVGTWRTLGKRAELPGVAAGVTYVKNQDKIVVETRSNGFTSMQDVFLYTMAIPDCRIVRRSQFTFYNQEHDFGAPDSVSSDGRSVVYATFSGDIGLMDLSSNQVRTLDRTGAAVKDVVFSPDNRAVAVRFADFARVYSIAPNAKQHRGPSPRRAPRT